VFYYGNARRLAERRASVRALIASRFSDRVRLPSRVEFERRLRPIYLENAYEEIRAGRFDLARDQLELVAAAAPDEPRLHRYYGELHRREVQRAGAAAERDVELVQARAAYERALALDPALAEAHRQLGLLYYAMRDTARARDELERYLALAPSAPDRGRIGEYVMELTR
jgi:tetratricopeptide (TPR) repeat protein